MSAWALDLGRIAAMVVGATLVHLLIRRVGSAYAADAFATTPRAGRAFLVLADIAY